MGVEADNNHASIRSTKANNLTAPFYGDAIGKSEGRSRHSSLNAHTTTAIATAAPRPTRMRMVL